jgi:hypothetical protein
MKAELLIIAFALLCFSVPIGLLEIECEEVSTGLALILLGICSVIVFLILNHYGVFWRRLTKEEARKK